MHLKCFSNGGQPSLTLHSSESFFFYQFKGIKKKISFLSGKIRAQLSTNHDCCSSKVIHLKFNVAFNQSSQKRVDWCVILNIYYYFIESLFSEINIQTFNGRGRGVKVLKCIFSLLLPVVIKLYTVNCF